MTLIDLEELQKYPFRYDNYDRKNGNPHFISGGESVLEYAETLPKIIVPPNEPLTFEELCAMAKRQEPVWCCDSNCFSAGILPRSAVGILCWRSDWSNVPERAANIWMLNEVGGCGIYLVMEFISHGAKFYRSKPEGKTAPAANAIVRLASYEDIGLTPEEIKALVAPQNSPLTLDDLREMDGEPVYCHSLLTGTGEWVICRLVECSNNWFLAFGGGVQAYGDKSTYGEKWLAYRRKPEEVMNDA